MQSEAAIAADDVRTVRQCGAVAVETLRRRANAGAADSVDRLEMETLKEIGKGGGFSNMNSAVQQASNEASDLHTLRHTLFLSLLRAASWQPQPCAASLT